MMTDRQFLAQTLARLYSPRSGLNAWQWGEKWVKLDSRESIDFQGAWDSSLTPYVRFLMEFVTGQFSENVEFHPNTPADSVWEEFILMKSSQLGFTLALLIVLAFWVAEVKQNAIYAIDSIEEARKISKTRLQPLLESCEPTKAALDEAEDEQSNLTLFLLALTVYLVGAHGKAVFRNKSAGLAILDELDAYPIADDAETNPLGNARARLKAVGNGKLITSSSPETEAHPTAKEEATGTQHRMFLPCPHCDHFQELVWEQVRFGEDIGRGHGKDLAGGYDLARVERETYYECELCHKRIDEGSKPEMMKRGRFRQTNPKPQPRKISMQISDLYSPFKKASWGRLAVEFIEAQGNPAALANFNKNRLGKPAKLQTDTRSPAHVEKLRGVYLRGTIPVEPCLVTVTSDVQGDVKKWVKCGWLQNGEMWVIDWGATLSFEELSLVAADPVPIGRFTPGHDRKRWCPEDQWDGPTCTAGVGLIDEGYITPEVRAFCQRTQQAGDGQCLFFPSKGRGGIQVRLTVQESFTESLGLPLRVYHYSDDDIKKLLYIARISRRVKPVQGLEPGPRLWLPAISDPEFIGELCSEQLKVVKEAGFSREKWEKNASVPNDWGDALKMQLVLWHVLAPLFKDWQPSTEIDVAGEVAEPALAAA